MKFLRFLSPLVAVGVTAILTSVPAQNADAQNTLNASGATFPQPLYNRWFLEYNKLHSDVQVNYNSVGSGQGIKDFTAGLTDFGASDAAMTDKEIAAVTNGGVVLLPMTAGSIVISYNLPGVTDPIKLPRDVYPSIFDGTITKWSDPKIAAANPGVKFPDLPITVASRADGSGTTFNFSSHLAVISPEFAQKLGKGAKQVAFPGPAGKGNAGVASLIQQTPGTIGYVEYGYAKGASLPMATLQNKAGKYVAPSADSGAAALGSAELPANLRVFITDPDGDASYPIVTYTWWLVHATYDKAGEADTIKALATWCLTDGQKLSDSLGYLPLPPAVVTKVQAALPRSSKRTMDPTAAILPESHTKIPSTGACAQVRAARRFDLFFTKATVLAGWSTVALLAWITFQIAYEAWPAFQQFHLSFLFSQTWDTDNDVYGALPFIYGTLVSSALALFIATPLGVAIAIFLTEDYLPPAVQDFFKFTVELLAAIPSVIYGLWGIAVVIPITNVIGNWLNAHFGWCPLFSTPASGPCFFPASFVLAIMVLPTIAALSRTALKATPSATKEGALALGATRWEVIGQISLPMASTGIVGAAVLALGRAMGETMALAMLVGNKNQISASLFAPANTIASLLANSFGEATGMQIAALMYLSFILMVLTLAINAIAEWVLDYTGATKRHA